MASQPKVPRPSNDTGADGELSSTNALIDEIEEVQNAIDNLNEQASEEILKYYLSPDLEDENENDDEDEDDDDDQDLDEDETGGADV
ncbi:unnamed protein product [Heterobilharzia americana]|nr:unnamed protein product [Heterobilharzia americana]